MSSLLLLAYLIQYKFMAQSNPASLVKVASGSLPFYKGEVYFVRPLFQDYSKAWKLFPGESRENPNGPGYQFEEFLAALCLRNADGLEPDKSPADAIKRFDKFDNKDRQALVNIFLGAFVLDQSLQDEAETYANELLATDNAALEYTIPAEHLPMQSASFTFRRLSSGSQMHVSRSFTSEKVNGCSYGDLLMLTCLSHINDKPIENPRNPLAEVYDLDLLDVQYVGAVFVTMFALDIKQRQEAVNVGKTLRASLLAPAPSTSQEDVGTVKDTTKPKSEKVPQPQ